METIVGKVEVVAEALSGIQGHTVCIAVGPGHRNERSVCVSRGDQQRRRQKCANKSNHSRSSKPRAWFGPLMFWVLQTMCHLPRAQADQATAYPQCVLDDLRAWTM